MTFLLLLSLFLVIITIPANMNIYIFFNESPSDKQKELCGKSLVNS